MSRVVDAEYSDPLDAVWLATARRIGLRVVRSADVYASTDGRGTLLIADATSMDADDCLAQMIFHELCHSLVQGPDSFRLTDWGLDNESDQHLEREHACLRTQAALLDDYGLRHVLAPTTDHRAFYDALGAVPFEDGRDPSSVLARKAYLRADREPWGPHLRDALSATQKLLRVVGAFARTDPKSLLGRSAAVDLHTVGGPVHPDESLTCGTCAWRHDSSRSVGRSRCRKHPGVRIDASMRACVRWEAVFDCQDCGACCREAYTAVEVKRTEPVVTRYPDLVVREGKYLHLRRAGERCAALEGGRTPAEQYTCRIYDDRPSTCREFALASPNCLDARRAVGLSR